MWPKLADRVVVGGDCSVWLQGEGAELTPFDWPIKIFKNCFIFSQSVDWGEGGNMIILITIACFTFYVAL